MSSSLDQPSRAAAHVLLDAVIAYDSQESDEVNTAAANLALQRLNDVDAVTATLDDNGDVQVNIDGLANAALYTLYLLATQLSEATGVDIELVTSGIRHIFDDGR